ncbi:MAG: AAA family ATPase, partial [Clostridiales bacterium]|nr:AAA family ATPase [Clostridiales bacterium]
MDRIKKITVLKVKMEGFKRFKEPYEVNMNKLTYIAGANGEGKTTLADAVSYAFCGTPFWGEGSCDRLKNPDSGKMSVEVCFADENGEVHNLSRTKNGDTTAVVLDGHTMRQADMAETFAEKNIFLSILNPLYFIEKLAGNGKDFLQKLMPRIPKKQILEGLSDTTKVLLETEEFAEPEVSIKDKRKEIRELGESALHIEGQIDALKKEFSEAEKNIDAVIKEFEKLVNRKNELEEKQPKGSAAEKADAASKNELYQKLAEAKARTYQSKYADEI